MHNGVVLCSSLRGGSKEGVTGVAVTLISNKGAHEACRG
jgi:hypothetical protein